MLGPVSVIVIALVSVAVAPPADLRRHEALDKGIIAVVKAPEGGDHAARRGEVGVQRDIAEQILGHGQGICNSNLENPMKRNRAKF